MSAVRLLVLLAAVPTAAGSAQVVVVPAVPPVRAVRIPNLSWIAPTIERAGVAPALAALGPALEGARIGMAAAMGPGLAGARIGMAAGTAPALAGARIGLAHARAALAATSIQLSGLGPVLALAFDAADDDLDRTPPAPWAQDDPADRLYRDARQALDKERFSSAADLFAQVYTRYPKSTYAPNAYYWQAYALFRRGSNDSYRRALDVLELQKEKAPDASTRDDADDLATRIRGRLARGGDADAAATLAVVAGAAAAPPVPPAVAAAPAPPAAVAAPVPPAARSRGSSRQHRSDCDDEDDMAMIALNALLQMDSERALPTLKKVLARRDEGSVCLRRKAMFIVSQHSGAETERILLDAARTDPDPEVRENAVFWLSQTNSPTATAALDSILKDARDPTLQEKAIFALSQQSSPRARQALKDFALRRDVPENLRENAVFWIGQSGGEENLEFLKTLYGQSQNDELKDKILFSISQLGGRESQRWLLGVAGNTGEDIELRKKALFWVGQSNLPIAELFNLYETMPNREMKEQLIFVYSQRNEKSAVDKLLAIARTEKDKDLQKKAIFWLSQSNDPRVVDFLASLLEKP